MKYLIAKLNVIRCSYGHSTQFYSPLDFIQLPVKDRVSMVSQRRLRFFKNTVEVDRHEALNLLRKWQTEN
ncbi:MAG: hypothetical protein HRU20_08145 [Pseudomonadales bacterium]|nr:hypothetical protein [Pseudomonadales bacterium]